MNVVLNLTNYKGFPWNHKENVHYKGNCTNYSTEEILGYLTECKSIEEAVAFSKCLYGSFAIVVKYGECSAAICDQMRSIPLFYKEDCGSVSIFDALGEKEIRQSGISPVTRAIFECAHFVTGKNTLLNDFFQIPAGHYLQIINESYSLCSYWKFEYRHPEVITTSIQKTYAEVFKSVADYIGDRIAVIPLSGGHDSRLVAYYLHKYGCKIIAYSYGEPSNLESSIAQRVAQTLDIPFYFIPYDHDAVALYNSLVKDYFLYSGNCTSTPHIQDFAALAKLKMQNVLPSNSVFVPGLGGVLTGHYVKESYLKSPDIKAEELIAFICDSFFGHLSFCDSKVKESVEEYIYSTLGIAAGDTLDGIRANELFEQFTFLEEQTKFIANAVRVYEFFGYSWMSPLFDQRLFKLWSEVLIDKRFCDKAFKEMEQLEYPPNLLSIPFTGSKEMNHFCENDKPSKKSIFIARLKRYCFPRKTHYLNKFISLLDYYRLLLFKRRCDVNDGVVEQYLRLICSL